MLTSGMLLYLELVLSFYFSTPTDWVYSSPQTRLSIRNAIVGRAYRNWFVGPNFSGLIGLILTVSISSIPRGLPKDFSG